MTGDERREDDAERGTGDVADRGPGAHSGAERRAAKRHVPGTAGATEGYGDSDTARGEPLTGVEKERDEDDGRG
jgi:hypothetical protein